MRQSLCIVTPDLIGPIKNGGIGTHAYNLASDMTAEGFAVTILFTGPIEFGSHQGWVDYYQERGIEFESIDNIPDLQIPLHTDWFVERSYRIYCYLTVRHFDSINFQEWQANGFHTIQAKKSTAHFQRTKISVTIHSNTEWIAAGNRAWNDEPVENAKLEWCERYCCANCDLLISPSKYMMKWCMDRGWSLASDARVIPYCYEVKQQRPNYIPRRGHLAFFGRLETRKGLQIFVEALNALSEADKQEIVKISFIGKIGIVDHQQADEYVWKALSVPKEKIKVVSDLSSHDAIQYLVADQSVVFIPSLVDNYPYTVIECCMNGIPVLASDVGGIPEMLQKDNLFAPNVKDLVASLKRVLSGNFPGSDHDFRPAHCVVAWSEALSSNIASTRFAEAMSIIQTSEPLVSICTPFYNHGRYIRNLVGSVQNCTYQNWELIIVDDGSTDSRSILELRQLSEENDDRRIRFVRKSNEGVGATRNHAASLATGEYLIFLDSDNYATPSMITDFVAGIRAADCEVMTCHFKAFAANEDIPDSNKMPLYGYAPIGPALEIGWAENVFGDANFIIKRSVFWEINGFTTERQTSWEDWDLLARLSLAGYRQDVIPMMLFWYRHTPEGFSRNTNLYLNRQRVLRAYTDNLPPYMGRIFREILAPYRFRHEGFGEANNAPSPVKRGLILLWNALPAWLQRVIDPVASKIDQWVK